MAIIDRYLEALQKHSAEALILTTGMPVQMDIAGQFRQVSSQTVSSDQLNTLFEEIMPGFQSKLSDVPYIHPYSSTWGTFELHMASGPMGLSLRIQSKAGASTASPQPPPIPRTDPGDRTGFKCSC